MSFCHSISASVCIASIGYSLTVCPQRNGEQSASFPFILFLSHFSTFGTMDNKNIQRLMAAEQEANAVVAEARRSRVAMLRQAKAEADQEILKYRAQADTEFKATHAKDIGSRDQYRLQLERQTDAEIEQAKRVDAMKKKQIIDYLLMKVNDVDTSAPGRF